MPIREEKNWREIELRLTAVRIMEEGVMTSVVSFYVTCLDGPGRG